MAKLRRRDFLGKAAIATASGRRRRLRGPASAPVVDRRSSRSRGSTGAWPRASRAASTTFGGAEVFAERVESLSEGRFRIRAYPAANSFRAWASWAVQQGTVELGHTASYYYTGKNPAVAFDTAMPFGLNTRQRTPGSTTAAAWN